MEEKTYWLGFSVFPGVGPKRFRDLLSKFKSAENAWKADESELEEVLGKAFTNKFSEFRELFKPDLYFQKLVDKKVSFVTLTDKEYPNLLKEIKDPPFVLYFKGKLSIYSSSLSASHSTLRPEPHRSDSKSSGKEKIIAIVGTRKITSYGRDVTKQITRELINAGFVIVSGLAFGVDACAHKATVDLKGKTIAVLGCGVDCCSPRENISLYNEILKSDGAIVSEIPLSTAPTKGSFPSRNRIIAGLSQAVVVTEGAADSGALYTANDALKIGRPVFAVPGQITSQLSKGPHSLIAKGAKLVTSIEDILKEFRIHNSKLKVNENEIRGDTKEEQSIINLLLDENLHFDELRRKTKIESSKLGVLLSMMEMRGILKASNGQYCLIY